MGKPGVEFYGHLPYSDHAITKLIFIPNQVIMFMKIILNLYVFLINMIKIIQGRLVSLSDDNSLHYWEINDMAIDEVQSYLLEGK